MAEPALKGLKVVELARKPDLDPRMRRAIRRQLRDLGQPRLRRELGLLGGAQDADDGAQLGERLRRRVLDGGGGFDGAGEGLLLVHGSISRSLAPAFLERLQRVAQDFSQQHLADQKLNDADREGYTLLLGMRRWEFEAFAALRRIA